MRMLISASLLAIATALVAPTEADARGCGFWARVFSNCSVDRSSSGFVTGPSSRGLVADPSVPEPGAAALFAVGAGLIAVRTRRRAR